MASPTAVGVTSTQTKPLAELRATGKQVAREAGGGTVAAFFEANKNAIKAVLPQHMTPDRMLKIALRALRTTPKLMDCTIESLFGAVVSCAQLGLEPNTPQGHIYLIPFKNKKKIKDGRGVTTTVETMEVQIIIGYKGLIDLARRSGQIESISSRVVYKNDKFKLSFGTDDDIVHEPEVDGDRGEIRGFYSVAKLKGGGVQFEWMSKREVDEVMKSTQSRGAYGPWKDNYEEMGRKTLIRRLCKYLPMSIELAAAAALDGRAEREGQGLSNVLDGAEYNILESVMDSEGGSTVDEDGVVTDEDSKASPQITQGTETPMATVSNDSRPAEVVERQQEQQRPAQRQPVKQATPAPVAEPAEDEMIDPPDDDAGPTNLFDE